MASNRRRLVSGSSSRRARGSRTAQSAESISLDLPPYEPPTCPLNEQGKQALRELSRMRINEKLKTHLDESGKLLASAVYDNLERVALRKRRAANVAEMVAHRRKVNGDDGGPDDRTIAAEQTAKELEQKVSPLTMKLEKSMREVLDMEAALQDEQQTLHDLQELVAHAQDVLVEQHPQVDEDDADQPEIAGVPIQHILETERGKKVALYDKLNMRAKYAQHNSYIDFRRRWNEGACFEQDVPVPDPATWFDDEGRPQHVVGRQSVDQADDDIQIASENKSYRCPLSLAEMSEPYTCRRCGHSFQKEALLRYLNVDKHGDPTSCPVIGCRITDMTFNDFYFDESQLRQIKRSHRTEEEADSYDMDVQEEEGGEDEEEEEKEQEDYDGNEDEMDVDSTVEPKAEGDDND